ncbi:MAG TPA: acetolactate decarboxylase [Polyangiaceae bacterium]|nr:acetolactate decarboxylase [Polyangiaceae bacterium]
MAIYQRLLGVLGVSVLCATINCAGEADNGGAIALGGGTDNASGSPTEAPTSDLLGKANKIRQFGTLDQLNRGVFDGPASASRASGSNFLGVGTFNALDGEMIVLDGVVYQFTSDGVVTTNTSNLFTPFAAVISFAPTKSFTAGALGGFSALQGFLTASLPNQNMGYAIKIHGTFSTMRTRSPRRQTAPYPTLAQAVQTQVTFDYPNVTGTMVGFRLPSYFGTVNATGYHFHFISDDRTKAGHVLDVSTDSVTVEAQTVTELDLAIQNEELEPGRGPAPGRPRREGERAARARGPRLRGAPHGRFGRVRPAELRALLPLSLLARRRGAVHSPIRL